MWSSSPAFPASTASVRPAITAHDGAPREGRIRRSRSNLLRLVDIQYQRNDISFERGRFRVRGDVVELWPAYEEFGFRIELFGDEIDALAIINPTSGETLREVDELYIYPAKHSVPRERIREAVEGIRGKCNNASRFRSKENCSKHNASAHGRVRPEMLPKSATVGIRTTHAGSAIASPASRHIACSTSSPTISS